MPSDYEAERMILGSCVSTIDAVNFCCAELTLEDFYSVENRDLFTKILDLYSLVFLGGVITRRRVAWSGVGEAA